MKSVENVLINKKKWIWSVKIIENERLSCEKSETDLSVDSIMIATSPKSSSFAKLGFGKHRPLRVMVVGQVGVGKTGRFKFIL